VEIGSCRHLTQAVYEKLRDADILSVVQFLSQDLEDLAAKATIPFRDLLGIKRYLLAKHACALVSGLQLYQSLMESTAILPTSCEELNCLLDGGIYTGEIVELCGEEASGKTQVCLCVTVAVASDTEKDVVYFDIGGGFSASRLCEILRRQGITSERSIEVILKRIQIVRVTDVFQLMSELHQLKSSLSNADSQSVKLVVIDCFSSLFVTLKSEDRSFYYTRIIFALKSMSIDFSFGVVLTKLSLQDSADCWTPTVRPSVSLYIKKTSTSPNDSGTETLALVNVTESSRLPSSRAIEVCISDRGIWASDVVHD